MIQTIARKTLHRLSGNRSMYYARVKKVADASAGKTVLEIGSGKAVNGKYSYSTTHLFPSAKKFVMTDVNPDFGHKVLDIVTMTDTSKYDVIVCLNVLEHVYNYQTAVDNLRRALKKDGQLLVAVPFTFPLHDEPGDYWRFTEHALRKIFANFRTVEITPQRSRRWPTGYFVTAQK